ncbi:cytochrome [Roseovarius faecimaris]|uniref:Cytochrome n=1 Tax=Roseovarius faecimaris TaxID=2494550 RepID=A0A6I6INJ5_9RHOB|nr:cytochrome b/b6 domain-containing protein [Roseovarius faecimaris]QGX98619.1 cytochrome [Roseovarius faecimaris]
MSHRHNTLTRYGSVAKSFHWLTALLILTIVPVGLVAQNLAETLAQADTAPDQTLISRATFLFSLHKTLGMTVFFVALLRLLWAVTQTKPGLLNGDKWLEARAAETVHWLLYGSLILVPLSGWVHHAATTGFAPIWWPFGQSLPFVPKDDALAETAATLHHLLIYVLGGALLLHIAGALKHHLIDGDATLRRMWPGTTEAHPTAVQPGHALPALGALLVWALVIGGAASLGWFKAHEVRSTTPVTLAAEGGNWQVQEGVLQITVTQMGSEITGSFSDWSALIQYAETPDETGKHGEVEVTIGTASLTLGTVTSQALGAGYLQADAHPTALFKGDIISVDNGLQAKGNLTIRDVSVPATLPFDLSIDGDTAEAKGAMTVDRRDFNMGLDVTDEGSLAFAVEISFDLTAMRAP